MARPNNRGKPDPKRAPKASPQGITPDKQARGWLVGGAISFALGLFAMYRYGGIEAGFEAAIVYLTMLVAGAFAMAHGIKLIGAGSQQSVEDAADRKPGAPLSVTMQHARWRHLTWALIFGVVGVLLIVKFDTVGRWLGGALELWAALAAYRCAQTVLHEAGTFTIDGTSFEVPTGLCKRGSHKGALTDIKHVLFLRRAVPWSRPGPMLVVELADQALVYPRDWFASDADQRRVAEALRSGSA